MFVAWVGVGVGFTDMPEEAWLVAWSWIVCVRLYLSSEVWQFTLVPCRFRDKRMHLKTRAYGTLVISILQVYCECLLISLLASRNLVNSFHGSYSTYSAPADVLHLAMAFEKVGGAKRVIILLAYLWKYIICIFQCCNEELELVRDSEKHIKYVKKCNPYWVFTVQFAPSKTTIDLARLYSLKPGYEKPQ